MSKALATVLRIPRDDTVQIREWCSGCGNATTLYVVLAEVFCDGAKEHIRDWAEIHEGTIGFRNFDYLRDEYGRVLGDLYDLDTGDSLTDYLLQAGAAKRRPHHVSEVMSSILYGMEPGDAVG